MSDLLSAPGVLPAAHSTFSADIIYERPLPGNVELGVDGLRVSLPIALPVIPLEGRAGEALESSAAMFSEMLEARYLLSFLVP